MELKQFDGCPWHPILLGPVRSVFLQGWDLCPWDQAGSIRLSACQSKMAMRPTQGCLGVWLRTVEWFLSARLLGSADPFLVLCDRNSRGFPMVVVSALRASWLLGNPLPWPSLVVMVLVFTGLGWISSPFSESRYTIVPVMVQFGGHLWNAAAGNHSIGLAGLAFNPDGLIRFSSCA